MAKQNIIINFYQWNGGGYSYENPQKQTLEEALSKRGFTTKEELIKHLIPYGQNYFIGTQAEYDLLKTVTAKYYGINPSLNTGVLEFRGINYLVDGKVTFDESKYLTEARWKEVNILNYFYYTIDGKPHKIQWKWYDYLKGNQNGDAPKFTDLVTDSKAIEIDKTTFDKLYILYTKLSRLNENSQPKLAAYISKGEDYLNLHSGNVKGGELKSFMGSNGKVDTDALEVVIKANQTKVATVAVLIELFYHYTSLIRTGTEDSLKLLPFDTPKELNAKIDELWKIENDKERKILSAKLGVSIDLMDYVDSFLLVNQGDEPYGKK